MAELLAPNGKPSNLSPEQYKLVRLPEFKAWFGDWENNPESASKVVDSNGEPLPVYHGSSVDFNLFENKPREVGRRITSAKGFYFTKDKWSATQYAGSDGFVKSYFLKILNYPSKKDKEVLEYSDIDDYLFDYGRTIDRFGYDGAIDVQGDFIVWNPNQIKLADGSNTTFNAKNPDIRFSLGGEIERYKEQGVLELNFYPTNSEHAKEHNINAKNPLYIQNLKIKESERLKFIGKKVLLYLDEYAQKNGHDVIFGYISQKATMTKDNRTGYFTVFTDIDYIKHWLFRNGYAVNMEDNDFHKVIQNNPDIRFDNGGETDKEKLIKKTYGWYSSFKDRYYTDINSAYSDIERVVENNNKQFGSIFGNDNPQDIINLFNFAETKKGIEIKPKIKKPQIKKVIEYNTDIDLVNQQKQVWEYSHGIEIGRYLSKLQYIDTNDKRIYGTEKPEENNIISIMNKLKNGDELPPILLDYDFGILDGHHRFEASKRLKIKQIPVIIYEYPDMKFDGGGVIINPTEIECHKCHWHWKVKDCGDDLFICHKCNYDNTKYYKFEGLKGQKILDTISSNNNITNNKYDGGGILDGLTEEQITYIDIISNYDGKGVLAEKYKKVLKEKTGIDYDEYYGKIDDDLIKNADVNNIKTKNDFLNYDNWIKYSYEILRNRGFDKNQPQHIEGKLTFDKIKEFCDNLNIPFEIIPENLGSGNYASHSWGTIKIPIGVDINTFIHEIGHFYDWEIRYEGIAKNPAYATSFYYLRNSSEVYAENFMHYFIATEWLKNNMPIVYEELDRTISLEYKKNITELINSLNNFKKGGRTISQTPAPEKDQIKGSDKNKEGSAKDISSAKKIKFSDDVLEKIQNSVDKHNKKHPNKKITIDSAKAVVRRGMGAYSSTHRPTISGGDENSRVAWGLARLNAFTYKIINGKSKSGKYSQDNDLIEELGYKVDKYEIGGVFHGSSYYFDKFNTEKIGSGIGQQQDGWGIYLTDDKKSSKNYGNYIYETTLFKDKNLDEYTFLDINKPVKKDLVKKIIEPFQKLGFNVSEILEFDYMGFLFYKTLSRKLGGDKKASLFLLNNGIDGIKRSFENSEGVIYRNDYVIFDENAITIESKEHLPNNYYADGGEINNIMKNEIIDILSKNARYGKQILSVQEVGFEVIQSCIESNTYFGNSIKQANENYIMIPVNYEDKLWAIDKKVGYVYFAKINENTKIRVEYKYDLQDYPVPILFDSEIMNNKEFYDVNDFEEINVREFDSEFLYRGINNDEMLSIIENSFIKSNASMNIGQQQAESTSFAQHISQASAYAVGFNAWYDEVTFAKPKYILKVKKEGVNYKPTIETDIQNEVDVFGEIPIQQIESIYEIKLGECQMGNVEINVGYENNFSEGSRSPMFKKVFVRKTDVNTLINEINSKNNIEKNNDMTNSNPKDTITMDIPLLIRFSELMREDIKTDVALHEIIENLIDIKDKGVLTMSDYDSIIGNVTGTEENTNTDAVEEEKMAEGGKVNSIKYKKGDIKISLDENWYSDDSSVELVPVSELMKFREFDRKVKPKYNQDNSRDNINHLKFMFQKDGVKEPIIIEYSAQDNSVLVIEGNHRINSAIDLGMEYLPARVVLKKYSKFTPSQLKNSMKVEGIKANSSNYIPSELKASHIGITGSMPIYSDGGIIEGRLHSECGDDGCGRKFQVGENGHIIEAERDEAVIVADAFYSNEELTIKGTPSEVASALNVIGGGKNFDIGATIIKNGQELEIPELKKEATDTDVEDIIDSGSIIINRRSMADEKEYKVTGTPKQIASAINSINGNGVVIEKGAEIKEN